MLFKPHSMDFSAIFLPKLFNACNEFLTNLLHGDNYSNSLRRSIFSSVSCITYYVYFYIIILILYILFHIRHTPIIACRYYSLFNSTFGGHFAIDSLRRICTFSNLLSKLISHLCWTIASFLYIVQRAMHFHRSMLYEIYRSCYHLRNRQFPLSIYILYLAYDLPYIIHNLPFLTLLIFY